jgi:uncharacterized membrane protein YphA (DoxX/SURF4 family)
LSAVPAAPTLNGVAGESPVPSLILLTLRLLLGGAFCLAAYFKIDSPQNFYEAIKSFHATDSQALMLTGAHLLPWTELVAGVCLVLGFWTRAAGAIIVMLMLLFIYAIIAAIGRGLEGLTCSCFGQWHLICKGGVGWCKVWENTGLTAIALSLAVFGGGRFSIDGLCRCSRA